MPTYPYIENYSNGYVVEYVTVNKTPCVSWLLLPAENLWPVWLRCILYLAAMMYLFVGIAIASDIFMCSIEIITSKKRKVIRWDRVKNTHYEKEILVWNATVANLTLLAFGSSAPEILLAVIEAVNTLGADMSQRDGLGTFTIIGSAAFNLLIITSICIVSVPKPEVKHIREFGVFILTALWSMLAYVWMLLVVQFISPGVIQEWEAIVTLLLFPLFVFFAYCQDNGWWCHLRKVNGNDENMIEQQNLRVMDFNPRRSMAMGHISGRELHTLEAIHNKRMSLTVENALNYESEEVLNSRAQHQQEQKSYARARFRHAVVSAMLGKHLLLKPQRKTPRMADIVSLMQKLHMNNRSNSIDLNDTIHGRVSFSSSTYVVAISKECAEVDVYLHRRVSRPLSNQIGVSDPVNNGSVNGSPITTSTISMTDTSTGLPNVETTPPPVYVIPESISVEYETRGGSAKDGKEYKDIHGKLIFHEDEYRKTLSIPVLCDSTNGSDLDFFVLLKNPSVNCAMGDPNIARITVTEHDDRGTFLFDSSQYRADLTRGKVTVSVIRQDGSDGKATIEYGTIDGTAVGGSCLDDDTDYIHNSGILYFNTSELSKEIEIDVKQNLKGVKNFIMVLRNPSIGARIGETSATICNITSDLLLERISSLLESDNDDASWSAQFRNAMLVGQSEDLRVTDYLLHFCTFFWKCLFAFIPPTMYYGAWPTFFLSLCAVGLLIAFVEQLGNLLGCAIGLENSITGITIIALGTSLPDTFASRTAAKQDEHADAAIGNITGSNSVNVFVGLGLPWTISSLYAYSRNTSYEVSTKNLTQSVIIFSICGFICIVLLCLRRKYIGGELGGKTSLSRLGTSGILVFLWFLYITLSTLKAYKIMDWNVD